MEQTHMQNVCQNLPEPSIIDMIPEFKDMR